MRGKIVKVSMLSYANVKRFQIEVEGGLLEAEIPVKLLQDVKVNPDAGCEVEVEITKKEKNTGDIGSWDIIMIGETYFKQEAQGKIYASAGGLQLVIPVRLLGDNLNIGDEIIFKIKFIPN